VTIPQWRIDITGEADISEEVIRILGLDQVVGSLPSSQVTVGGYSKEKQLLQQVRKYLNGQGLDEVLTYSLVRKEELTGFPILTKGEAHHLFNPLTDEHEYLRLSLMPSLLKVAAYNLARGNKDLAFYEVSDIDSTSESGLRLALVLVGNDLYRHQIEKIPYSFYHLKGIVEGLTNILGIKDSRYSFEKLSGEQKELHPGRSALLKVSGKTVGYLGEIHPLCLNKYELGKNNVFVLEIDLNALLCLETGQPIFKAFSKFPAVKRDLSLVSDDKLEAHKIIQAIMSVDHLIKNVDIFDIYVGSGVADNKKSIALTITYERDDQTLKDEEVATIEKKVIDLLNKKFGITLRV